jgi:hypothetical protein
MIEQRSFGAGSSAAMGMGFEGGQGVIPVQPNRSRDMLAPDNIVASLIGTVKAKSQFLTIKKRHVVFMQLFLIIFTLFLKGLIKRNWEILPLVAALRKTQT